MLETSEKESVMSTSTTIQNVQTIDVTSSQSAEAQEVTRHFNEISPSDLRIRIESSSGDTVTVPESLSDLLQAVLRLAATGETVGITRLSKALTSVEAAKFLGMSRPTLMKLASSGEIPSHKVGSHARFNRTDLQSFAERRIQSQRESFDDLRSFEDSQDFAE
jgi:excisionase family DNA binding protein